MASAAKPPASETAVASSGRWVRSAAQIIATATHKAVIFSVKRLSPFTAQVTKPEHASWAAFPP